ncbi:hypothetical protein BDV95DRAFT_614824 [Massariosphaeria phaeospora]|uniref:Uncharacterized protein n=1 Tax=Massariosphaeria phaeospora TaxID=100035 RepID=A0A7C8IEM1_9PLEO|nr:hypothetical protein BDV95DRAFT_614824 [Massariosphaeria phaeospora]
MAAAHLPPSPPASEARSVSPAAVLVNLKEPGGTQSAVSKCAGYPVSDALVDRLHRRHNLRAVPLLSETDFVRLVAAVVEDTPPAAVDAEVARRVQQQVDCATQRAKHAKISFFIDPAPHRDDVPELLSAIGEHSVHGHAKFIAAVLPLVLSYLNGHEHGNDGNAASPAPAEPTLASQAIHDTLNNETAPRTASSATTPSKRRNNKSSAAAPTSGIKGSGRVEKKARVKKHSGPSHPRALPAATSQFPAAALPAVLPNAHIEVDAAEAVARGQFPEDGASGGHDGWDVRAVDAAVELEFG